jgi:hypothetical protein
MSTRCTSLPVTAAAAETVPAIALAAGAATSARGRRDMRLQCLSGVVWATRAGDPRDHILRAGESLDAGRGVRIAALAVADARVRFVAQ